MEPNKADMLVLSFFKGVKEFGLAEAIRRITKLTEKSDISDLDKEIMATAFMSTITLFLPELMESDEFIDILSKIIGEAPQEEINERIDMAIEMYKNKLGGDV